MPAVVLMIGGWAIPLGAIGSAVTLVVVGIRYYRWAREAIK